MHFSLGKSNILVGPYEKYKGNAIPIGAPDPAYS